MSGLDVFDKFVHKYGRLPTEFDPDYLEMLRMSKFSILSVPHFKPSKCANCGSCKEDGRSYIDFGLEIEFYGILYLCSLCLKEIALRAGLFNDLQDRVITAESKLASIESLHTEGKELHDTFLHTFEEVKKYFASLHSFGDGVPTSSSSVLESDTSATNATTTKTESRTTKQNSSRGSTGLRSLAELLESDS